MNRIHPNERVNGRMSGESGASLVEYVLLLSLIALVALAALSAFGSANQDSLDDSASRVVNAG